MRRKKVEPFNPFAPRRENSHQFEKFSDEWVKHNKWMGDENTLMERQEEYQKAVSKCRTKIRMPSFEDYVHDPQIMEDFIKQQPNFEEFYPPLLFNFQNLLPIKEYQDDIIQYLAWQKKQEEKLGIFEEMLSEKSIRAGKAGVGEAHKGWGRSKRKG